MIFCCDWLWDDAFPEKYRVGVNWGRVMSATRVLACCVSSLCLFGCASAQLNFNTLEIASTVESLQTKQVLYNISKFIDNPDTVPDQVVVSSGSVGTTNSITPNLSNTLVHTYATAAGAAATGLTRGLTQGQTAAATDQWTQSWGIAPISDGDDLRRLRALYLSAALGDFDPSQYPPRLVAVQGTRPTDPPKYVPDPYFTDAFHALSEKNLCKNWIYYTGPSASTGKERPPVVQNAIPLGRFGNHDLYTTPEAKSRSCLSKFVLLVLDAAGETATPSAGGTTKPKTVIQMLPGTTITPDQLQ